MGVNSIEPLSNGAPRPDRRVLVLLLAMVGTVFVWSGIRPRDRFTWVLEVFPVILALPALLATWRRFPLTTLVYVLIAVHAIVLLVGGHYTYAEVPAFNWLRDRFGLSRNYYDRVGHFVQGFVPAMVAREVLLRTSPLRRGKWLFVIVVCVCLAISASYELFEWAVARLTGTAADQFLGTQGDPWDTQEDMATALVGAVVALLSLSGVQDVQMGRIAEEKPTVA
jgi:putative membrane protein